MVETLSFAGKVLCSSQLILGEGPSYEPETDTIWWFNILGKELHELKLAGGEKRVHPLPRMASVAARIDDARQLIAMEDGLYIRDRASGALSLHAPLEADRPENRSNDGRVHRSGALWIGTMGKKAEPEAGAIYHVARGTVTRIVDRIGITNGICFSPDGATGYFVDTKVNRYMKIAVDPATGLPTGEPQLFADASGRPGGVDGSVCDASGDVWNARWGEGCVERYDPAGRLVARYATPARQPSCPAFFGPQLDRLLVTTATEGMDAPGAPDGCLLDLGIRVNGRAEHSYLL
ncbi:SMP-30/gluconolactonase/LRE family protein [Gellertiella hungarica]|uniref:Sugar lactone lactonase YvrE n=1 Tax=Gellertiella hungarica TaxID=1572859 RepID=A0A7W6J3W8_9HYPH|nr:SMP-30/gluconolactonase/LRE family protein [Gellertiella hungarica]MBB4064336.1 sugar lactone lactonase YvrE [Gellertiella hungarica]